MRFLLILCGLGMLYALVTSADLASTSIARAGGEAPRDTIVASAGDGIRSSGTASGEAMRDASGRFHVAAEVHGVSAGFLVDTGADTVVLTPETARRMGIYFDPNNSEPVMETANGVGTGHRVTIDRMTVFGKTVENVPAIVADRIGINLMGQNVLRQLGVMQIDGDRLSFR